MPSDGRFRLVVFAGNVSDPTRQRLVNDLGAWLAVNVLPRAPRVALSPGADPHGGTMKFMTDESPSVIDVLLIHNAQREDVEILRDLHDVYHPFDSKLGWDYDKVFVDGDSYHEGHGAAYKGYGVDEEKGAIVIVRPDGYVGLVTGLGKQSWNELRKWFDGIVRTV